MMGSSHALSGAAVWVAGCALSAYAHRAGVPFAPRPDTGMVATGALLCAGAALLPDLDHHSSHATRSLAPVTTWLHKALAGSSAVAYRMTRTRWDDPDDNGRHRRLTHTVPFAAFVGVLVGVLVARFGAPAGVALLFICAALMARALMPDLTRRQMSWRCAAGLRWLLPRGLEVVEYGPGLLAAALVTNVAVFTPMPHWGWWAGLPIAVGSFAHCLGDAITKQGCPFGWPFRIRGKRWYDICLPAALRFRTGSAVEHVVVGLLAALLIGSGYAVLST